MCNKCINCNNDILVVNTKKYPNKFCSYQCYEEWNKFNKVPNCKCSVCGKAMYLKPYRFKRLKNSITCSLQCAHILKSTYMKGTQNHQYNIIGELHSSFKGIELSRHNHNITDILVYCPEHPFKRSDNRIKKHRLLVEEHYKLFDSIYFIEINKKFYLKPEVIVHHINGDHNDNSINNLKPLFKHEHSSLHAKYNSIVRDKLGHIIGIVKSSNIGGNL